MSAAQDNEPAEGDLLAPWRAVEKLDAADAEAFRRLYAEDPDLARGLDAAAEERDATVALNEALPAPSRAALDRLFVAIEAHEAARAPKATGVMRWLSARLTSASPGALAWGATAAALLIALQAGLLARAYLGGAGGGATYETASDTGSFSGSRATALVAFQPGASAGQIAALLRDAKAEIVAGPKPGGVFEVRLSSDPLTADEIAAAVKRLADAKAVVRLATPSEGAE